MYGKKNRFNDPRYNDIPDITVTIQQPKRKINPDITVKSIITRQGPRTDIFVWGG